MIIGSWMDIESPSKQTILEDMDILTCPLFQQPWAESFYFSATSRLSPVYYHFLRPNPFEWAKPTKNNHKATGFRACWKSIVHGFGLYAILFTRLLKTIKNLEKNLPLLTFSRLLPLFFAYFTIFRTRIIIMRFKCGLVLIYLSNRTKNFD